MKKILYILVFCTSLFAYTYEELKAEPKSLAKDYFLYLLLKDGKIPKDELKEFRKHIFRFAGVMKKEYEIKAKGIKEDKAPLSPDSCWRFTINTIMSASEKCQTLRLENVKFASKLSYESLGELSLKYKNINPELSSLLSSLAAKNPILACKNNNDGKTLLKLYYDGYKFEDFIPNNQLLDGMMSHSNAYKFLNSALVDDKFPQIRAKLAKFDKADAAQDLAFALGLNALMHDNKALAEQYFLRASKTYKYKRPRDNALFFAYLASDKLRHLDTLAQSSDLNMYSLLAKELMNMDFPEIIVPNPEKEINYPISDPLKQARFSLEIKDASKEKLESLKEYFYAKNTLGHYLVINNKLTNYKEDIYPIPFPEYLDKYLIEKKALILAIAMQESRFLPASVSISYALGMTQFIPSTARFVAKTNFNDNNFDVLKMFEPKTAYEFAGVYVDTLQKSVKHPAFIAYAYNGGLGFTQRMLKKDNMFSKTSKYKKYEPFLSMELVPYQESRLYAKKVLANYYIYLKILGKNPNMQELINTLYKN